MISAIKKPFIDTFLKEARKYNIIDGVVLFGSVITEKCCEESDVDLIVVSKAKNSDELYACLDKVLTRCLDVQMTDFDCLQLNSFDELFKPVDFFTLGLWETGAYFIAYDRNGVYV